MGRGAGKRGRKRSRDERAGEGGSGAKIRTTGARGGGGLGAAKRIVAMSTKEEKEQPAVARGDERGRRWAKRKG